MSRIIDGVRIPDNPKNGEWYGGRQYWDGTLSQKGQINELSNQQGAGGQVSKEVVDQSGKDDWNYVNNGGQGNYFSEMTQSVKDNAVVELQNKQITNVEQYLKDNPFAFDDAWLESTKKLVQEEVDLEPYYKEKLTNYITDVETKKTRAGEDQTTILKELDRQQTNYLKQDATSFQQTRENALEGLSTAGTVDTGAGMRTKNLADITHKTGLEDYTGGMKAKEDAAKTSTSRYLADLGTESTRFKTDLEREKELRVESEVLNRKSEKQTEWQQGLYKASGQVIPGYMGYLG